MALLFAAAACWMAIATPAPAQADSTAASAYSNSAAGPPKMRHERRRFMQASIGHRRAAQDDLQPGQDDLQPTWDDFQQIERDNRDLDLPASQDDIVGAGGVHSREEDLAREFEQLGPWNGRQIRDICPSCGGAEGDVMRGEARVTHRLDRRYDHLTPSRNQILRRNPTRAP